MKATVPEIAWHNKAPVFTVDIQSTSEKGFYRAATGGGDSHVVIWHLVLDEVTNEITANFAADLDRHIKAVNVVRFSKNGELLASGDDDAVIIIWALKDSQSNTNSSFNADDINKENWVSVKTLRGHKDDIYDICWHPFSNEWLLSGSVDNTAIIWNVEKGLNTGTLGEHNGFVQGVAWDPKDECLATLSSDRALRVFESDSKKLILKVTKAKLNKLAKDEEDAEDNYIRLFHDDTVKTFFRRLTFSPDGLLLFVPCGTYKEFESEMKPPKDVTYVFIKDIPDRPVLHLPSPDEYTVAVKCCPLLFELNPMDSNAFNLPYRIVFAVASRKSIVFYDTQQTSPFAFVTDIHYATLTDLSWSTDGRLLLVSSSDGYCTIVTFQKGELGVPYTNGSPQKDASEAMDVDEPVESNEPEDTESVQSETEEQKPEIEGKADSSHILPDSNKGDKANQSEFKSSKTEEQSVEKSEAKAKPSKINTELPQEFTIVGTESKMNSSKECQEKSTVDSSFSDAKPLTKENSSEILEHQSDNKEKIESKHEPMEEDKSMETESEDLKELSSSS